MNGPGRCSLTWTTDVDVRHRQQMQKIDECRKQLVGPHGDPTMSTRPIDVMLARRVYWIVEAISPNGRKVTRQQPMTWEHHSAADWFLLLYRYRNGGGRPKGTLDDRSYAGGTQENERRDIEWFALLATADMTAPSMSMLVNLLVFLVFPRWLITEIETGVTDIAARTTMLLTLNQLKDIWLKFGDLSDDRLRAMSVQGRAQIVAATPPS